VSASQTAAVTATQAALAIVGSIIASTLITILIYFLVIRHQREAKRRSREQGLSLGTNYSADPKFPPSDQNGTTIAASQSNYPQTSDGAMSRPPVSFSQLQNAGEKSSIHRKSLVKATTVAWNPSKPPKPPTLHSWLKLQDGVSPFGPINLPTDIKDHSPLGGQLKSPLRSINAPKSPQMKSGIPVPIGSPKFPSFMGNKSTVTVVPRSQLPTSPQQPDVLPKHSIPGAEYRESKESVWTEGIPYQSPSPPLQSPPKRKIMRAPTPASLSKDYGMTIPSPKAPVRTTAEWLAAREDARARDSYHSSMSTTNIGIGIKNATPSFWLPSNSRGLGSGLPRPNQRSVRSVEGDVQGLNRFLAPGERGSQLSISRTGSERSVASQRTPGVGEAL
jgi:hypothetical protein